jgi:hypothetical protein
MDNRKLEKLNKFFEVLKEDTISAKEIEQFLLLVVDVIKKQRDSFDEISGIRIQEMNDALEAMEVEHQDVLENLHIRTKELLDTVKTEIEKARQIAEDIRLNKPKDGLNGADGKNGKDADEELIVERVMERVILPDVATAITQEPEAIRNSLELLEGEERLDASAIKNLPEAVQSVGGVMGIAEIVAGSNITIDRTNPRYPVVSVSGEGSSADFVNNEIPTGTINGSNTVFTTAYNFISSSTQLYLNGLRLKPGASNDYTESSTNQITFSSPPQSGDSLLIDYRK